MHHHNWAWLLAIYPTLHIGLRIFIQNAPEPDNTKKTWYGAIYKTLEWFAIGNGKANS